MRCCELSIDALQQPSKCAHVLVCNCDMSDLCKHSNDNDGKEGKRKLSNVDWVRIYQIKMPFGLCRDSVSGNECSCITATFRINSYMCMLV